MSQPSDAVVDFAAAAYDYVAEKTNPAKDGTMLHVTWLRLVDADARLSVEDRRFLGGRAGR